MAKGTHQKLKMLYLAKIFSEETDEQHPLTMPEVINKLHTYGVNADRKTLYMDFDELRDYGFDIISNRDGRNTYYFLGGRDFQLPELKLLVDSVQFAKFITEEKSNDLIKKLESLCSKHEAKQLNRQILLKGRVKTTNDKVYYSVDALHDAICNDMQVRFQYCQWNVVKQNGDKKLKPLLVPRKNGADYCVSPWHLAWDDEYYYLIAYDSNEGIIKHFRVDKMEHIEIIKEKKRDGKQAFENFNMANYSKSIFGMFGGEKTEVTLLFDNSMVGVMIDRFGNDLEIFQYGTDENHYTARVNVIVSQQFLGWIFSLGESVKIIEPENIVEKMKQEAERLCKQYS